MTLNERSGDVGWAGWGQGEPQGPGEPAWSCRVRDLAPLRPLPGNLLRGCSPWPHLLHLGHQGTQAGFTGFNQVLVLQGRVRDSRVETKGPVTLISVLSTSAEQLPCSPDAGLLVGGAEPGLGTELVFRVPWEVGLVAVDVEGEAFPQLLAGPGEPHVCAFCPQCLTLVWPPLLHLAHPSVGLGIWQRLL